MKIILLAAGQGSRISKKIGNIPKSMVDVDGIPLIRRTVDMLSSYVCESDISIIVGYEKDCILHELSDTKINFFENPFYRVTNSIASLWFAAEQISEDEDIIIANADVFWHKDIFELLIADKREAVMLSDKTRTEVGDYFFKERADKSIEKYGKELPLSERSSEYLGVAKISKTFSKRFKERLIRLIENGETEKWWENVLYSFTEQEKIFSLDVKEMFWAEVDYIEDYERILKFFEEKKSC